MKTKLTFIVLLLLSACSLTGTGSLPKVQTDQQTYIPSTMPVVLSEPRITVPGTMSPETTVRPAEAILDGPQPSLFIFGDSTADHAVETIARLGLPYRSKAFISYQCPFLSSDWLSFGQTELSDLVIPNKCSDWETKGIDQLKEWKPDIVLLWASSEQFDISCKKKSVCSYTVERLTFEQTVGVPVVFVHWPNWTNPSQKEIDVAQASLAECQTHKYCFDGTQLVESLTRPDRIHLATPDWGNTDSIGTFILALTTWIKETVK
jgi:hypothetical protein